MAVSVLIGRRRHERIVKVLLERVDVDPNAPNSVRRRPGARRGPGGCLPRAPDGTGRLAVVRLGRPKRRSAVFGQDGGPYRVRHVSAG